MPVLENSDVLCTLPDGGRQLSFRYTPVRVVPRRKATLTIDFGDQSVTFEASRANLKAFVSGLKDCIRMIVSIEG